MGTSIRYLVVSVCLFSWKYSAKDHFLKLEKCCGHFWSFSLDWPPCPRRSLILVGPKSTKERNCLALCLMTEKNSRFALGESERKEHLNRRSRNRSETVLVSRKILPSA